MSHMRHKKTGDGSYGTEGEASPAPRDLDQIDWSCLSLKQAMFIHSDDEVVRLYRELEDAGKPVHLKHLDTVPSLRFKSDEIGKLYLKLVGQLSSRLEAGELVGTVASVSDPTAVPYRLRLTFWRSAKLNCENSTAKDVENNFFDVVVVASHLREKRRSSARIPDARLRAWFEDLEQSGRQLSQADVHKLARDEFDGKVTRQRVREMFTNFEGLHKGRGRPRSD
ncbi:MAG: hypothetical protein AAGD13_17255 [Pseudomonadota bacterium]